jgi:hypothetical protein
MKERKETAERIDPHEAYGIQRVPKSSAEALGEIKKELQREMSRRAGAYGRRLMELLEAIEAARDAFDGSLEMARTSAIDHFGPEATQWPWNDLVARIEALPPDGQSSLASEVRSVQMCAERYKGLRVEWAAVRQHLIIHREAMGFRRHHLVDEKFPTPDALPPPEVAWRGTFAEVEKASR